ncbi:MAG: hypothetical protein A2Y31_06695 [Spirochaetes bacterium GWC2_52_13]|nr:MAG: hypothetical protein A2Y31_06695 [Spirochaetes bacterium GWC2_52_13]
MDVLEDRWLSEDEIATYLGYRWIEIKKYPFIELESYGNLKEGKLMNGSFLVVRLPAMITIMSIKTNSSGRKLN